MRTMSTWSQIIPTIEDVPPAFRPFFDSIANSTDSFPYCVFAPRVPRIFTHPPDKMICDIDGIWQILEHTDGHVRVHTCPLQNITDIEIGHILLQSWLTINGLALDGTPVSPSIEFNSVSTNFYEHFIDQFKPAPVTGEESSLKTEQAKFDALTSSTFKYMNYGRHSISTGEEVLHFIWQPEIRVPRLPFRHLPFFRTITTAHLLILTDKQVILLREDERSRLYKGLRYGGVRHFIPLHNITSSSLNTRDDGLLTLSLHLRQGRRLEWPFADSHKQELEQFQSQMENLLA